MSYTDPVADLLTRIRNAHSADKKTVHSPSSGLRMRVLDVLKKEGYIRDYSVQELRPGVSELVVELKYYDHKPVIQHIKRVSRPGRRVYCRFDKLPSVYNGMGISVLSTSKGVMSDADARDFGIGGEVLLEIY